MYCDYCGEYSGVCSSYNIDGVWRHVCNKCMEKLNQDRIENGLKAVERPSDFVSWSMRDLSEAFWIHLGRYKNHPNKYSLSIINMAFRWACHEDHGLSNSFKHAMDWCEIDLFNELQRTDLPEK